jgi:hypothetical protein
MDEGMLDSLLFSPDKPPSSFHFGWFFHGQGSSRRTLAPSRGIDIPSFFRGIPMFTFLFVSCAMVAVLMLSWHFIFGDGESF